MIKDEIYRAYVYQRNSAKRRNIDWQFTYCEWIEWWQANLGTDWFKKRGRRKGQYVMARKGDKGPYTVGNIECVTCINNGETKSHANTKGYLTSKLILEILNASGSTRAVAKRYGVYPNAVQRIRTGEYYHQVTGKRGN